MGNLFSNFNAGTVALVILIVLVLILIVSNIHVVQQIGRASCRERV